MALTRKDSRGVVDVPPEADPADAPEPPALTEAQETDGGVTIRVAIFRSPEEDETGFAMLVDLPPLGNKFGMSPKIIQDIGRQDKHTREPSANFLTINGPVVHLIGREMENDLPTIQKEVVAFAGETYSTHPLLELHPPVVRNEGAGIAINNVFNLLRRRFH